MRLRKNKVWGILANVAILFGLLMSLVNVVGLFHYRVITGDEAQSLTADDRSVSEAQFWGGAFRKNGESVEDYAGRLMSLVSGRMIAIDPKYAKPTLFENWILWIVATYKGEHEWLDTKKAIRAGGGFCSQHAIVFNNILREQGVELRILGLSGHVVNEVLIEGQWKVFDSDYNVHFDASLAELEADPGKVYSAYRRAGMSAQEAMHWRDVFARLRRQFRLRRLKAV